MADSIETGQSGVCGVVTANHKDVVANAGVRLQLKPSTPRAKASNAPFEVLSATTDANGRYRIPCPPGDYIVESSAFGSKWVPVTVPPMSPDQMVEAPAINLDLPFVLKLFKRELDGSQVSYAVVGEPVLAAVDGKSEFGLQIGKIRWVPPPDARAVESEEGLELRFESAGRSHIEASLFAVPLQGGAYDPTFVPPASYRLSLPLSVAEAPVRTIAGDLKVRLQRPASEPTLDEALWFAIRDRTAAISFERYRKFLNRVLLWEENERLPEPIERRLRDLGAHLHGTGAYQALKTATEVFLLLECGVRIGDDHRHRFDTASQAHSTFQSDAIQRSGSDREELAAKLSQYLGHPPQLPYIRRVVEAAFPQYELSASAGHHLLVDKITEPCLLELIWSYWHEEGMLMQTMNAIARRFQNIRRPGDRDPLLNVAIDPLRPANNILWGYVQDEPNRLSVLRRSFEYDQQYGVRLCGKNLGAIQPAESRSKFLEAFHNLLYQSSVFFKEDAQTTVIADGYPLLNALKDVHLILAYGANGQFGSLQYTARAEMLLVQFMLARPEIRDFLQSRAMVPYKEPWMPQVDAMKTLQGWSDVTVTHFRDLGVFGEQLLLSVRYGDWTNVNNEDSAKNWARFHKEVLYGYWNAYRAVTGIDLTNPDTVDSTPPALLLQRRLIAQQQRVR